MKQFIFILTISFFHLGLQAQTAQHQKILSVLRVQEQAWNNADLKGFMAHYWQHDSLTFVSKKGIKKGWQAVYDGYQKSYADKGEMGSLTFKVYNINRVNRKNAMVTGSWKVVNASGTYEGYFTLWFKKLKRKWLIIQDHTS
jgi:ketosteroid isomerase-like protein